DIKNCVTGKSATACAWAIVGLIPVAGKYVRPVARGVRAIGRANKVARAARPVESAARICSSFVPGTKVMMADGSQKPIEEIKTGDKVVTTDSATGKTSTESVSQTISTKGDKKLVQITIDPHAYTLAWPSGKRSQPASTLLHRPADSKGGTVVATATHPFWVAGDIGRWVKATALEPGMWLRASAGTYVQVTATKHTTAHHQRVHNLTITHAHTYFVLAGETPVLVHNCGGSVPRHRTICDCANGGKPAMMRGPTPKGTGLHNLKIAEVAGQVTDGNVIAGGGGLPERAFATPGGFLSSRRPDILVERPDGSLYGINVGKQAARSGAPIKREAEALQDLENIGISMYFVPYN
ncbi:hypothetical protein E1293_45590, partial [Actinomadura darangshiensis]